MLSAILHKPLDLLENLVVTLEQYEENEKRPRHYSNKQSDEQEAEKKKDQENKNEQKKDGDKTTAEADEKDKKEQEKEQEVGERLKDLSLELLDIGLYHGQRGLDYLKQTPVYTITDQFVHYEDKYEFAKDNSVKIYRYVNESVYTPVKNNVYTPVKNNLYIIYDTTTEYYSFMVKVLQENQAKVIEYVKEHYDNVSIRIQDNWLKLDFNNDGKVSFTDLKQGVSELYEFLVNYDYIQKATEIKNTLYDEAIKYMKKDVHHHHEDEPEKEKKGDAPADGEKKKEDAPAEEKKTSSTTTTKEEPAKTENKQETSSTSTTETTQSSRQENNQTTTTTTNNKKNKK